MSSGTPSTAASEETLRNLLTLVARSDRAAFDELSRLVAPFIYGRARQVLRDEHVADDVMQVVLLKLWRQADRFDGSRGSVYAWLSTVTRNSAIDRIRSEERQHRIAEAKAESGIETSVNPDADYERTYIAERVRSAMSGLPADQRTAIELAYFGDLSYVEVARHLDVPEGTIKSRIRRGLARLSTELQEDDG